MLPSLQRAFQALPRFRSFVDHLPAAGQSLRTTGLPGGSVPLLVSCLADRLSQRTFLVVTAGPSEAERWLADLEVLMMNRVRLYPQREALGEEEPHREIAGERVESIAALVRGDVSVIVTTSRATAELTGMPERIASTRMTLSVGDVDKPASVVQRLLQMGYERCPTVLDVPQFAVRGGIIDLYGFGMFAPTRVEWLGDEIISIRGFDLDSQRSEDTRRSVTVLPVAVGPTDEMPSPGPVASELGEGDATAVSTTRQSILELLPPDTVVLIEPGVTRAEIDRMWSEAEHHLEVARRLGEEPPRRDALFLPPVTWESWLERFPRIYIDQQPYEFDFALSRPEAVERDIKRLRTMLAERPTLVLCDNEGQLERLEELVSGGGGGGGVGRAGRAAAAESHAGDWRPPCRVRDARTRCAHRPRDIPPRPPPSASETLQTGYRVCRGWRAHRR